MPSTTSTLFISAVTGEFGSYRAAVARFLDLPGTRIEVQEKFVAAGQTMLVRLSDYIKQCDAVVHLIGDHSGNQFGGIANPAAVRNLLEALPLLLQSLRLDVATINALSYTQWEAWLAIFHGKKLFIAVPESWAPRDSPLAEASEAARQCESQRAHLEALAREGRFPEITFGNSDQLCLGLVPLRDAIVGGSKVDLALTNILSLSDYRAGLGGFRRFLSSEHLPFQAPPRGTPSHPEELLKRLETSEDGRGVLLAGVGGVGKTRTTFETAQLAESQGWRVLYVLPGQPAATAEKIMGAVLASGPGKTMVVIEYLDQMHELDLGVLRRHVIQSASRLGIRFGLMANCRPGWLLKALPERDATLETVTLDLSAPDASRLSSYVADYTAPMALQSLGEKEMMRLCGHRPIIALLVSQQLEQLAKASRLYLPELAAVRSGDLAHWLRRRLAEDGLIVPESESIWIEAPPPPHLVAAAAALACSPDDRTCLIAAAASALENMSHASSTAARVVSVLVSAGWLETQGPWLHTVHDVVTDEVVEQVSFELDAIRPAVLGAVLSPALTRARSLGPMVKTLTRVDGALSPSKAELLRGVSAQWLKNHAEELGGLLADAEPGTGSYALGSLLGGSMFEDSSVEHWPTLVAPWLRKYETRYEARHLLHRGLRSRNDWAVDELVSVAMAWLKRWRKEEGASFVIGPLLRVWGSSKDGAEETITVALLWLDDFSDRQEAEFVLNPLLGRRDLTGEPADEAIRLALQWLVRFKEKEDSGFVLHPLLGISDIVGDAAQQALELALQWLERFNTKPEAGFVLAPLLARSDLQQELADQATALTFEWLERFKQNTNARFVLQPLLKRADLKEGSSDRATALALAWLEEFKQDPNAEYVLGPMLERADLSEARLERVVTLAFGWLELFKQSTNATFLLQPLLGRDDLKEDSSQRATWLALEWAEHFKQSADAKFVLKPLVERADSIRGQSQRMITLALEWVERFEQNADVIFVLKPLLMRPDLKEGLAERAIALTVAYLERANKTNESRFILHSLLSRGDLKGERVGQAVTLALQWLVLFGKDPTAHFVFTPLLERADLRGQPAEETTAAALEWLDRFEKTRDAMFVLRPLLKRADLTGDSLESAIRLALSWVESFEQNTDARFVLQRLLERADLREDQSERAISLALQWVRRFKQNADAMFALTPLLERTDLKEEPAKRAIALALEWLECFSQKNEAQFVFHSLLFRGDLKGDPARQAINLALGWLEFSNSRQGSDFVLKRLLGRIDLEAEAARKTVALALGWLKRFSEKQDSQFVLRPLLSRADLRGDLAEQALDLALQWLVHFGNRQEGQFVLTSILARADMKEQSAQRAISSAIEWLGQFGQTRSSGFTLQRLLDRADLRGDTAEKVIAIALEWLVRFGQEVGAGFVLKRLLDRADLKERAAAQTVELALQWLGNYSGAKRAGFVLTPLLRIVDPSSADLSVGARVWAITSEWIRAWGAYPEAGFVLVESLTSGWSDVEDRTELREAADRWATLHEEHESGGPAISIRLSLCPAIDPEAIKFVNLAEGWIDSHLGDAAAANVLRALLAKNLGDERIREFVAERGLILARNVSGVRVRTLLRTSMKTMAADNPRKHEIETLLDRTQF